MNDRITIQWTFDPPDFFSEDPRSIEHEGAHILIHNGRVTATLDAKVFDSDQTISHRLDTYIGKLFNGTSLQAHRAFTLSPPCSLRREYADGRQDATVFATVADAALSFEHIDIRITDSAGNVVVDTRAERQNARWQAGLEFAHDHVQDDALDAMLASYASALADPDNELIHLYEILETLVSKFGSGSEVQEVLGICPGDWSRFGYLANRQLRQARHRGFHYSNLRDATPAELEEARRIAARMMLAYSNYLKQTRG